MQRFDCQEGIPLLSTVHSQRSVMRRPILLAALAVGAVVALCGSAGLLQSSARVLQEKYDLPDGVEPVDQLAFSKAVKAHEMSPKKLDDVASRSRQQREYVGMAVDLNTMPFQRKFELVLRQNW